jgi:hypothetical protein
LFKKLYFQCFSNDSLITFLIVLGVSTFLILLVSVAVVLNFNGKKKMKRRRVEALRMNRDTRMAKVKSGSDNDSSSASSVEEADTQEYAEVPIKRIRRKSDKLRHRKVQLAVGKDGYALPTTKRSTSDVSVDELSGYDEPVRMKKHAKSKTSVGKDGDGYDVPEHKADATSGYTEPPHKRNAKDEETSKKGNTADGYDVPEHKANATNGYSEPPKKRDVAYDTPEGKADDGYDTPAHRPDSDGYSVLKKKSASEVSNITLPAGTVYQHPPQASTPTTSTFGTQEYSELRKANADTNDASSPYALASEGAATADIASLGNGSNTYGPPPLPSTVASFGSDVSGSSTTSGKLKMETSNAYDVAPRKTVKEIQEKVKKDVENMEGEEEKGEKVEEEVKDGGEKFEKKHDDDDVEKNIVITKNKDNSTTTYDDKELKPKVESNDIDQNELKTKYAAIDAVAVDQDSVQTTALSENVTLKKEEDVENDKKPSSKARRPKHAKDAGDTLTSSLPMVNVATNVQGVEIHEEVRMLEEQLAEKKRLAKEVDDKMAAKEFKNSPMAPTRSVYAQKDEGEPMNAKQVSNQSDMARFLAKQVWQNYADEQLYRPAKGDEAPQAIQSLEEMESVMEELMKIGQLPLRKVGEAYLNVRIK